MTIAACYVTPEGVVLGADSTASFMLDPGGFHYFNYNQKVFELGDPGTGTLGVVTWGLSGLGETSYRTLFSLFSEDIRKKPPKDVAEVATRWVDKFWAEYSTFIKPFQDLSKKKPFDPTTNPPDTATRTNGEEAQFEQQKRGFVVGFCVGGYILESRKPEAFTTFFDPLLGKPAPTKLPMACNFWGAPNMIQRLLFGCDDVLKNELLQSGKWNGTTADLDALLAQHKLSMPYLPIRDAIDFTHACIATTIKAMKFSSLAQICGGPIEIAVITTDRRFRWVWHKEWDAAIAEGIQ